MITRLMCKMLALFTLCLNSSTLVAQEGKVREWTVEGVKRKAIIKTPASKSTEPAPVIFGFHGHGGTMMNYARKDLQKYWPEAIIVSPQGLPTPGRTDPNGEKPGWQKDMGDQKDRDLHFVDAILKTLREEYQIDHKRIYATGHSNGGGFTYLLWAARPEVFAAYAPSAAGFRRRDTLKPAPIMHLAGEKDTVVVFANQLRAMSAVRKINLCEESAKEWAPGCKLYASSNKTPFVSYIHAGTHKYPDQANELIIKFFKEHKRQ